GLNKVKTSALRRWLVLLGLIARDQTTRLTGGYDEKLGRIEKRYTINFCLYFEGIFQKPVPF
ncbi:MAG: hypothetical protein KHZ78_03020, partial [Peptoniphilus sp. oral taxon 375]|nr:hypothetical protein [Peptoniphilus sp. oral taxon 375]